MAVFKRGKIWWYKFKFGGRRIQESSKTTNKHKAHLLEAKRKSDLVDGNAGIRRKAPPPKFGEAVQRFLAWSRSAHRPKTQALHEMNCDTLTRYFGTKWMDEITPESVEQFRLARLNEERRNATDGVRFRPRQLIGLSRLCGSCSINRNCVLQSKRECFSKKRDRCESSR
jgi:hypothetical protein